MRVPGADKGDVVPVRGLNCVGFDSPVGQGGNRTGQVVYIERQKVYSLSTLSNELGDRAGVAERGDELDLGIAERHEGIADAEGRDVTRLLAGKAKVLLIRGHCAFQVVDRDHQVIQTPSGEAAVARLAQQRGVLAVVHWLRIFDQHAATGLWMKKRNDPS